MPAGLTSITAGKIIPHAILVPAGRVIPHVDIKVVLPEEVEQLNDILERAGLGRPLGTVEETLAAVPLAAEADPATVAGVLHRARLAGADVPEVSVGVQVDPAGGGDNGGDPLRPGGPIIGEIIPHDPPGPGQPAPGH